MNDEFDISITLPATVKVSDRPTQLEVFQKDGVLKIQQLYINEPSLESALEKFLSEVSLGMETKELAGAALEAAVYYSTNRSAYFKVSLSASILTKVSETGLKLEIIGYPCSNTE
ncbi:hypothetical protein [Metapseudomonas otitidis]|uniref:hypothetical protein n=1 Tax=Metapseudomonas otitidis TaxID=319939 RepID=UPI003671CA64